MSKEIIDLDKALALGGSCYNHSGQIIEAGYHDWLFLGDDYDQYSAMDALVRNILDHPNNWDIDGEIVRIEDDGQYLQVYYKTVVDIDSNDEDVIGEKCEDIPYKWRDCETLVNTNSHLDITVKRKQTA